MGDGSSVPVTASIASSGYALLAHRDHGHLVRSDDGATRPAICAPIVVIAAAGS